MEKRMERKKIFFLFLLFTMAGITIVWILVFLLVKYWYKSYLIVFVPAIQILTVSYGAIVLICIGASLIDVLNAKKKKNIEFFYGFLFSLFFSFLLLIMYILLFYDFFKLFI